MVEFIYLFRLYRCEFLGVNKLRGWVNIKKNLGCLLLFAVTILVGCSDSANQVESEKVEHITPEQIELVNVYKENIEKNLTMVLFKDFYKRYVEGEGNIEINDDLIEIFNVAIKKEIDDGIEKYHDSSNWISEEYVSEENKEYLAEQELKYTDDTKKTLTDFIDNFDVNNTDATAVDTINLYGYLKNNIEIKILATFVEALRYSESDTTLNYLLELVSPHYSGLKGHEIKQFVKSRDVSLYSWVKVYNQANGTMLTEEEDVIDYNPSIGMTVEEVINSTLGKPNSINRTVTASSVREQWVYGNGLYLYFEDGIFTSFQD